MRKSDVLKHFKTGVAAARAVGRTKSAFSQWGDIIPEGMAYKYAAVTKGKLKVDPSLYQTDVKTTTTAAA